MLKVYISSTYEDLKKEREVAAQAVRSLGHTAITMEDYGASDRRPLDKCLADVRSCDVYVGIFAWRYGHIPNRYKKSITHLEYEEAKKAGKQCLIFLLDSKAPWPVDKVDKGEGFEKIDQLRKELRENHVVSFFTNADQLGSQITIGLKPLETTLFHTQRKVEKDFKKPEELIGKRNGKAKEKETPRHKWILVGASIIVILAIGILFKDQIIKKNGKPNEVHNNKNIIIDKNEEEFKEYLKQVREHLKNGNTAKARENLELAEKKAKKKEHKTDIETLKKQIIELENKEKQFAEYYAAATDYFSNGEYNKALESISKAKKIKNTENLKNLEIKISRKIKEQEVLNKKDDGAYNNALAKSTIYAYQQYLNKFPSGRHAAEADEKVKKLKGMPDDVRKIAEKIGDQKINKNEKDCWEADYGDGIKMVYIPEGKFTRGSKDGDPDEKPLREVYLDGYWMGKTEVTLKQFNIFVKDKGYETEAECSGGAYTWTGEKWERGKNINWENPGFEQADNHPVVCISWNDAKAYCEWLSDKKGLKFKLPTEAQWEKAARGPDGRKYPWRNHPKPDETLANFNRNKNKTSLIGSYHKGASPYGLLDMAGNVWEWCRDRYDRKYYKKSPAKNPPGPIEGASRVGRGGAWNCEASRIRCANRRFFPPSNSFSNLGFRLSQEIK